MTKIPVTVIVPVKNEELNLPYCLDKLDRFSEVIIVDSKSTDRTPEISKKYGYQIIDFEWNGQFPKKRNWVLRNVPIANEWVLFIDADEFLTPEFIDEIALKITSTKHDGFWLSYDNFFMSKHLKYGDKMRKLALFKNSAGEYERIEEDSWSHLDMEVHEHPIIKGSLGKIISPIIHKDFKGLEHYINRHNAYSTWEAKRYMYLLKTGFKDLNRRQEIKYRLLTSGLLPSIYFLISYILKYGFLDGITGYLFAKYKANYFFQIQTKIKEIKLTK